MNAAVDTIAGTTARPFGWRDKAGYLFGDWGNDFVFLLASSYLTVFYTDVAGLNPAHVGTLFLVSRLIDAFTDVSWGRFLDRHTPSPAGRYRVWIARCALPLVVMSALLYAPFIADWTYAAKLTYATVTYLLWGSVFYTAVNISYGSLASVLSTDPGHRASLSVFRAAGANLAGLFVGIAPPLVLYTTVDGVSQVVPAGFFTIGVLFAAGSLIFYLLCYSLVRERVRATPAAKPSLLTLMKSLSGNRALLSLMAGNLTLMLSSLLVTTMAAYLWLDYFNDGTLAGFTQLVNFVPGLLLAPFGAAIARRFGKREVITVALFSASAIYIGLYFAQVTSPWLFIPTTFVAGFGVALFNLLVWALITDVIDHEEVRSHERDDGTVYAINTWARKLGQALAGGLGGYTLSIIGYQSARTTQSPETLEGIYRVCTLVPGVLFAIVAAIMLFWYPLSRARVAANVAELATRRNAEASS